MLQNQLVFEDAHPSNPTPYYNAHSQRQMHITRHNGDIVEYSDCRMYTGNRSNFRSLRLTNNPFAPLTEQSVRAPAR